MEKNNKTAKYEAVKKKLKESGTTFYTITTEATEFYVSDISRVTLKKVAGLLENKPIQAFEIVLNDIFLGGDRDVFDDSEIFLSVMPYIMEFIEPYEIETKETGTTIEITIKDAHLKKDRSKCKLNRKLTIGELGKLTTMFNNNDLISAGEFVLNTKWIEGDKKIKTDNRLFLSVIQVISNMLRTVNVNIKKN